LDQINAVRDRADKVFGVQSTPTFFINGKKMTGGSSVAEFDKLLEPLLKG
jgi:protein-disulfide isomerase